MQDDTTTEAEAEAEAEQREFVTRSPSRTAVLERLVDGPADASNIASERSISVAGVEKTSGSLSVGRAESASEELREKGLVELLVAEDERAYGLTAKGERVLFSLERDEEP